MQLKRAQRGFTLTELAVVMVIIGFLVAGGVMTFNAQVEQRNYDETLRRLNAAAEAVLAFAIVNKRLPCPAAPATTGVESPVGGGTCTNPYNGFLPAETIGFQHVDSDRYGVDAYNNRIRYAVSATVTAGSGCTGLAPSFTHISNLRTNGVACRPATTELDVCTSAACTTRIVTQQTAVLVVLSTGKNGANAAAYHADETENTNATARFVSRTPGGSNDSFDDLMVVVPVGILYSRLLTAGVLP